MNKSKMKSRFKGMFSISEENSEKQTNPGNIPVPSSTNLQQINGGPAAPGTPTQGGRTTPVIIAKVPSYTPNANYKPVLLRPEPIDNTPESNLSQLTNVTSKFITDNFQQIGSKGLNFIKTNLTHQDQNPPTTSTSTAASGAKIGSAKHPTFVRQSSATTPKTTTQQSAIPKLSKISRQVSLLSYLSPKKHHNQLKPTNSLPTPSTPSRNPPLNLDEYRIKLAKIRALDNVNQLSIVNSITSAPYVPNSEASEAIVPNGTTSGVMVTTASSCTLEPSNNSTISTVTTTIAETQNTTQIVDSSAVERKNSKSDSGIHFLQNDQILYQVQVTSPPSDLSLATSTSTTNTLTSTLSPTHKESLTNITSVLSSSK